MPTMPATAGSGVLETPTCGVSLKSVGCERATMVNFWEQYADLPTVESMMLNKDASDYCEDDRLDILSVLPTLTGKGVVEMGAGIGRFTGCLARTARHVLATDFIESFILKNTQDHEHLGNVSFQTTDALSLTLDPHSTDFVFTNWLLMYFTDAEVVHFLLNVLRGLAVGGKMHVRESCTERSTRAPTSTAENPTYYRHASQYLELLSTIRLIEPVTNDVYGFRILWAKSVPTYIERKNNWRQAHMMVEKVRLRCGADTAAADLGLESTARFVDVLERAAKKEIHWVARIGAGDFLFDASRCPLDELVLNLLSTSLTNVQQQRRPLGVLNLAADPDYALSSFSLAKKLDCCVVGLESSFYSFSALLGQCNAREDKRVRFQWARLDNRDSGETMPDLPNGSFNIAVGINIFLNVQDAAARSRLLRNIGKALKPGAELFVLEATMSMAESLWLTDEVVTNGGFVKVTVNDVTSEVVEHTEKALDRAREKMSLLPAEKQEAGEDLLRKWARTSAERRRWYIVRAVRS